MGRLSVSMRLPLSVSALALALAAAPAPLLAQGTTTPPPGTPESSQQDDDPATAEPQTDTAATAEEVAAPLETGDGSNEIVVTGSRIARPEFSFPNPIQSFTAASVEQSGEINITDFLVDTPALVGSSTSGQTSGSNGFFESAGLNLLNLRNLGVSRTLVLVNSRRHVAGYPGTAAVDVNSIPTDLIDRIDVLTGGTSAIYGADGVSGVVNFVLKRNFEGVRMRGQSSISQEGDAGNLFGSIVAGKNFADDRGNIAVAYEYARSSRLNDKDRPFTGDPLRRFELLPDPTERGALDEPGVPDRILFNDVRWQDSSPGGAIDLGSVRPSTGRFVPGRFDGIPDFTGEGGVYDRGRLLPGSGGRTIGGSGTPTAGYFGDFLPYLQRHNFNALASFQFSPAVRLFAEGKYVETTAFTISQPTFDFFTFLTPDNAFLQQRFGALAAGGALVSRDNLDFGIRGDRSKRKTLRGVLGLDGTLSDHLRYEISYVYGQVKNATTSLNDRIADRYFAALDAVVNPANGQITCRINLPGETIIDENNYAGIIERNNEPVTGAPLTFQKGQCVPLNILGNGSPSRAALDFVLATHTNDSKITQEVLSGYLSGDLGFAFELPGGPIGFAIGAEYRKETSSQDPSEVIQQGYLLDSSQILPARGDFDVKEAFAELTIPVLKDTPFFNSLTFGGAVRFSDYSTVGQTTTWKVDGVWSPVKDITFRGTYSQAVRAPNISELFDPLSGGFAFITDPCDIGQIGLGTEFRRANCTAQLGALGVDVNTFNPANDPEASTSQLGLFGGNPNLGEETAKTWTAGVVLRPRFVPGLTVAADWYDIRLRNAINSFTASQLFALCVDQPTLQNVFCENIERDPTTGFASNFFVRPQNVANFRTSGLDVTGNYRFVLSDRLGSLNLRVTAGYLKDLVFVGSPGATPDQDAGEGFAPKYLAVGDITWTKGPLTINYGLAWQSHTRRFTRETLAGNPDISDPRYFFYKERWEHDIQAQYNVGNDFTFYGGVNNFTNQKPSVSSGGAYPVSAIGRTIYFGVKANLGGLVGF